MSYRYLDDLERDLKERHDIFCSLFKSHKEREKLEEEMKKKAESSSSARKLGVTRQKLDEIFTNDKHCGSNKKENGEMMWKVVDEMRRKIQEPD